MSDHIEQMRTNRVSDDDKVESIRNHPDLGAESKRRHLVEAYGEAAAFHKEFTIEERTEGEGGAGGVPFRALRGRERRGRAHRSGWSGGARSREAEGVHGSLRRRPAAPEAAATEEVVEFSVDEIFAYLERHLDPESFAKVLRSLDTEGRGSRS